MRVKPAPFEYHRPATAAEAVALLHELGEDAKVLAGGQSLVPMLSLRLAVFEHLIDIGGIESLRGIERCDDAVWIGAATTDAAVEASPEVAASMDPAHQDNFPVGVAGAEIARVVCTFPIA